MRIDDFVGLPWRERGRTRDGCDCWGLGVLLYRELLGIELPSRATDYQSTGDRVAVSAVIADGLSVWGPVVRGQERPLDGVLMRERPWHIGWVVQPGLMLHMPVGRASVIEPYTTCRHAQRVVGVYRFGSTP